MEMSLAVLEVVTDALVHVDDTSDVMRADGTELEEVTDDTDETDVNLVYNLIFKYVAPVVILAGTAGNLLSLIILQSRYFRRAPSTFILSCLSLTDTGVLLCGLLRHWILAITEYEVDIRALNQVTCWIHYLFTYMLPQLSSWSLALLSLERMASVKWPLKARQLFNRRRMVLLWAVTALCLAAINSHCFRTLTLEEYQYTSNNETFVFHVCVPVPGATTFINLIWPWLDLVLISLAPLSMIITCNIIIVATLFRAKRLRSSNLQVTGGDDGSESITAMLVGNSIMFFFFTTPVSIYFIGVSYWPQENHQQVYHTYTAYALVNIIYYLSNSTNFLVYCISGSRFRQSLVAVLCCSKVRRRLHSTDSHRYQTSMTSIDRDKTTKSEVATIT